MAIQSITSSATTSTGKAQDVSSMFTGTISLSLADEVTGKVQPYIDRADNIATAMNKNAAKYAAYQTMQSLLQVFDSASANLTNEALIGSNALAFRTTNLSAGLASSATTGASVTPASSILTTDVSSNASLGTHTVVVKSLATAEVDTSSTINFSSKTALNYSGSFSIGSLSSSATINVTSDMSITNIASTINGISGLGVTASVVSVDASHSVLVLSSSTTDSALTFSDTSGSILQNLGIINSGTLTGVTQTSKTSALGLSGSFNINGSSSSVSITTGMTLSDVVDQINSVTGSSIASLVTTESGYQLSLKNSTNTPITFSNDTGILSFLGLPSSGALNQVSAPQAAVLTVDGVAGITRSTNTVSDVLSGITLNLTQADPNTAVTLQVVPDEQSAASAIQSFVTAYNNWNSFVLQNEATNSDGSAAAGAVLFGDATLRQASQSIATAISSSANGSNLRQIGITLDGNNNLNINSTTLYSMLNESFSYVSNLFDNQVTTGSALLASTSSNITTYKGTFTLGITSENGTISNLTINGVNDGSFIFSGNSIIGLGGYSGLYLKYSGTTSQSIAVTVGQGLANQIYTIGNGYASPYSGSLVSTFNTLLSQNNNLATQYNTQISQANSYTNFLVQQYGALSSQIQQAGRTTYVLQQMMNAQNSNN